MILIEQIIELLHYLEEKIQSLYKCFLYSFMYTQFETIQTAQKFTVTKNFQSHILQMSSNQQIII